MSTENTEHFEMPTVPDGRAASFRPSFFGNKFEPYGRNLKLREGILECCTIKNIE